MIVRRVATSLLVLAAFAGGAAAAEPRAANQGPASSESFTMQLRERTRTFVVHDEVAYLTIQPDDLDDPHFLAGKEVMLAGKFERGDGARAWFYGYDRLVANGLAEHWATRLEGDNVYVFGRIDADGTVPIALRVVAVVLGESDAQIIARRLEQAPADDHAARLAVAAWVRENGERQGNRDFWQAAADTIIARTVDDAAAIATARQDAALLVQAVGWSLDLLRDPVVAARVASQAWLFDAGSAEAETVAKRLRALHYDYYKGAWRPRPDSLAMQFDDRFAAIGWRDAEAFYKLGRWVEAHAEELPRARELSHRCYQAGFRGDPAHNGIRREIGLAPVASAAEARRSLAGSIQDPSGVNVYGPEGWTRGQPIDGDATWIDPRSETAYISARVLTANELGATFADTWVATLSPLAGRAGFASIEESAITLADGEGKRLRYSYLEGRYTRFAEVALAFKPAARAAVLLSASYTAAEQQTTSEALSEALTRIAFPAEGAPAAVPRPPGAADEPAVPAPKPATDAASAPKPRAAR